MGAISNHNNAEMYMQISLYVKIKMGQNPRGAVVAGAGFSPWFGAMRTIRSGASADLAGGVVAPVRSVQ